MPYNFKEKKVYSLDYNKLYEALSKNPVMENKAVNDRYLKSWFRILKKYDEELSKSAASESGKKQLEEAVKHDPEICQEKIMIGEEAVYIHFRTGAINRFLYQVGAPVQKIPAEAFTQESFLWNKPEKAGKIDKKRLVVIVPFIYENYRSAVASGEEVIDQALAQNIEEVPVIGLAEQMIVERHLTATPFDQAFYVFLNEMSRYRSQIKHKKATDFELMDKAYFNFVGK